MRCIGVSGRGRDSITSLPLTRSSDGVHVASAAFAVSFGGHGASRAAVPLVATTSDDAAVALSGARRRRRGRRRAPAGLGPTAGRRRRAAAAPAAARRRRRRRQRRTVEGNAGYARNTSRPSRSCWRCRTGRRRPPLAVGRRRQSECRWAAAAAAAGGDVVAARRRRRARRVTLTGPMQIAGAQRAVKRVHHAPPSPSRCSAAPPPLLGCALPPRRRPPAASLPARHTPAGTGHDGGAMGGAGAQPAHDAAHCARTAESGSLHAVGLDATREAQSSTGRASGPMPAQPGGAGGGGASAQ